MSTYLWFSPNSKETANWLVEQLSLENAGTVPPRNYAGIAICYGAKVSEKFRWEDRNFQALLNDPRIVEKFRDRKEMFSQLSDHGISVLGCVNLTEEANYSNVCNLLGTTEGEGFAVSKPAGNKARLVTSQTELQSAIADGCVRALDPRFVQLRRIRLFVVGGEVVAATKRSQPTNEVFAAQAAQQLFQKASMNPGVVTTQAIYEIVLKEALEAGLIVANHGFWSNFTPVTEAMKVAALNAAAALELDFCGVDVEVTNAGSIDVLNVVTTPNLRDLPSTTAQTAIVTAISKWITDNSMTAKEILLSMIQSATDDEAETLLEDLRERKAALVG